jgi:hypothetical protein
MHTTGDIAASHVAVLRPCGSEMRRAGHLLNRVNRPMSHTCMMVCRVEANTNPDKGVTESIVWHRREEFVRSGDVAKRSGLYGHA